MYISLIAPGQTKATMDIKDVLGRVIYSQNIDLTQGYENTQINTSNFAAGTYVVTITYGNSTTKNIKVIINGKN